MSDWHAILHNKRKKNNRWFYLDDKIHADTQAACVLVKILNILVASTKYYFWLEEKGSSILLHHSLYLELNLGIS